jgi:hypothetical protein
MKDLSTIIKSKKHEYIFWKSILFQFSLDAKFIVAFPTDNENDVQLVVIDNESPPYDKDEDYLYILVFRNIIDGNEIGKLIIATVSQTDYDKFKTGQHPLKNIDFSKGIEIYQEDIPNIYNILQ